jgi:hypothetical protein
MPQKNNKAENKQSENKKTSKLHAIRTFKTDTSEVIKKGEVSLTDIFLKQRAKKPRLASTQQSSKNKALVFTGLGIIACIVIGISLFLFSKQVATEPQREILRPPKPILLNQKETILELTNKKGFGNQIKNLLRAEYNIGDIIYIPLKKESETGAYYLNTKEFLSFLQAETPAFLTTAVKDGFFLGILILGKNHPILIFEIKRGEHNNAFAGMLKWEKHMLNDLGFMLKENLGNTLSPVFTDKIIKNQNVRAVEAENNIILLYSIFNKKYLIITENTKVFEEIIKQFVLFS